MVRLIAFYRPWWLLLDGFRLAVRAVVEMRRNSILWPLAMTLRWAVHLALGSPWFLVWLVGLVVAGPTRDRFVYGLAICATIEAASHIARLSRNRYVVGLWTYRRTRSLFRRWPRAWGDYAGRTNQVQAATGAEPSTPVRWRPLADHPRLSWLYLPVAPGVVEFVVGPPPDRTYADLVTASAAMAAKFSFVESIEVDYPSDRSSLAVLTVTFTRRRPTDRSGPVLRLVDDLDNDELAS